MTLIPPLSPRKYLGGKARMEKGAKLGIPEWMQDENAPRKLFEVTCVVGEVWEDLNSQHTPREAAFNLIATHGADGDYTFPLENGDILHVIVETHING